MVNDSDRIITLIMGVRTEIPTTIRSIEADTYLSANVGAREGNKVAIIVRPKPFKPLPPGIRIQDKVDELYHLIGEVVLKKAKDCRVEVQAVRED